MNRFKIAGKLSEAWGWIVLVISFAGIGAGLFFTLSFLISGLLGLVAGILSGIIVSALGIYIAIRVYRGKGTMHALSRTIASPDLDKVRGAE